MDPDALRAYPSTLRHSTQNRDIVYRRSTDFIAFRGAPPLSPSEARVLEMTGDDGELVQVYRATGDHAQVSPSEPGALTPVYALPSGRLAVPTGRVFVRFREDVAAETRAEELKRAGYRITRTLGYAPNAAWVEADDGEASTALRNIDRLEAMSGAVNVEPQLLTPRIPR
jgi:hypothetical protein